LKNPGHQDDALVFSAISNIDEGTGYSGIYILVYKGA
jgi:hypothetical protein